MHPVVCSNIIEEINDAGISTDDSMKGLNVLDFESDIEMDNISEYNLYNQSKETKSLTYNDY